MEEITNMESPFDVYLHIFLLTITIIICIVNPSNPSPASIRLTRAQTGKGTAKIEEAAKARADVERQDATGGH